MWREVAADLGAPCSTLTRWCEDGPEFVPVVVPDDSAESVSLVSPTGWRIEGLSLTRALELVRMSGC